MRKTGFRMSQNGQNLTIFVSMVLGQCWLSFDTLEIQYQTFSNEFCDRFREGKADVSPREIQNFLNRLYSTLLRLAGEANAVHQRVEAARASVVAGDSGGGSNDSSVNPFYVDRAAFSGPAAVFPEVPVGPSPSFFGGKSTSMLLNVSEMRSKHHGPPPVNSLVAGSGECRDRQSLV